MPEKLSLEIFSQSPLAAELNENESRILLDKLTVRTLKNDEVLLKEGETDHCLYGVCAGMLAITRDTGSGDWVVLHVLKPGSLAGELGFIDGQGHSATLRAIGDATVFQLERGDLEALLAQHPHIVYRVMRAIVRAVHDIVRRMNMQYVEFNNYISKQHGRY